MKWVSRVFWDCLGGDLLPTLPLFPFAILVLAAFPLLIAVAPGWSLDLASYEECGFVGVFSLDSASLTFISRLRTLGDSSWELPVSTGLAPAGVTRPLDFDWWLEIFDVCSLSCISIDQLD